MAMRSWCLSLLASAMLSDAFFLIGHTNILTTQRIDPIVDPGKVAGHVHTVIGGSSFGLTTNTASLQQSTCTTNPIKEDKSNYWFPTLYFQWKNGSFSSVDGGVVTYYLFDDAKTTAFPDNFRMISGDPTLRSFNSSSFAQQAVTFLCLDFDSKAPAPRTNNLPTNKCPSGIRAQINFPSCWNGQDVDSDDHKSHVAFRSTGVDTGSCTDPKFPVSIPRIFMEFYTQTASWDALRSEALNPDQPYIYSTGDPTGYGYHADFINGWDNGILQNVVDKCSCSTAAFGDPQCCADAGVFNLKQGGSCAITDSVQEQTLGTIRTLPGNNPKRSTGPAPLLTASSTPAIIGPVKVYTNGVPPSSSGVKVLTPASSNSAPAGSNVLPSGGAATSAAGGYGYGGDSAPSTVVKAPATTSASSPPTSTGSTNSSCSSKSKRRVRRSAASDAPSQAARIRRSSVKHRHVRAIMDTVF